MLLTIRKINFTIMKTWLSDVNSILYIRCILFLFFLLSFIRLTKELLKLQNLKNLTYLLIFINLTFIKL